MKPLTDAVNVLVGMSDQHNPKVWVQEFADTLVGLDHANTVEERRRCTVAYLGLVPFLDDNVGAIIGALETSGQADRSLVVYTSDHGDLVGSRGLWGKSLLYEESAGIPMVVSGPGVPAGRSRATIGTPAHTPAPDVDGEGVRA